MVSGNIPSREIERILASWGRRHGLRVSDVYRDTFYYVDIVDNVGGKYEISICEDEESELIKVRVWNHQKKSRGFTVEVSDLEKVLERAYSTIITWVKQSHGSRIFAA